VSCVDLNSVSSAVRSMVVDFDLERGRDEEASPLSKGELSWVLSIESKAALARPKGVATLSDDSVGSFATDSSAVFSTGISSCGFVDPVGAASPGVGVGDGVTMGSDFFRPPPKKLFKVCCLPLNSSRNLVANLGGSGTVLGGSVGYSGVVEVGRLGGLSWSLICSISPDGRVIESCRSM
jgi:hypothetical protein